MYSVHETVVLRSPAFSTDLFFGNEDFKSKVDQPSFLEALYLASPSLFNSLSTCDEKKRSKVFNSLYRYFTRACFRCTPFGLFAGISVVTWGKESKVVFDGQIRTTVLDMHCLTSLANNLALNSTAAKCLKYSLNNTLYTFEDKARYVEFTTENSQRRYCLSQAEVTDELRVILLNAIRPTSFEDLVNLIIDTGIDPSDAEEYLRSLIKNQILFSELEPQVTGKGYTQHLIERLSQQHDDEQIRRVVETLQEALTLLNDLDTFSHNAPPAYLQVESLFSRLFDGKTSERSKFRVDLLKNTKANTLSGQIRNQLQLGLDVLVKLCEPPSNENLERFKQRFQERFENRDMPLVELLDPDIGIGYAESAEGNVSALLSGIVVSANANSVSITKLGSWLLAKLQYAHRHNLYNVNITNKELDELESNWEKLPVTFPVFFRATSFSNHEIFIESAGGSNAMQSTARFASYSASIKELIKDIADAERKNVFPAIKAEIIHLPETTYGDVVIHEQIYEYEIPYLSGSCSAGVQQLPIHDLYVRIESNKIKLISKRLEKEVIPTLSNAHNFDLSPLPVYRFLCDLQTQDKLTNLTFSWGPFSEGFRFLPRVTCGKVILHLATWKLPLEEFENLLLPDIDRLPVLVKKFTQHWRLPRRVVLVEHDQELFIDFENIDSVNASLDLIKTRTEITLKEYLMDEGTEIQDVFGQRFSHQFIASIIKTHNKASDDLTPVHLRDSSTTTRTHLPGSEWLYFKLYCTPTSSDGLLVDVIKPITEKLFEEDLIDSWFFVRYKDVDHHLRLRLHLTSSKNFGQVTSICSAILESTTSRRLIWKVQIEQYDRELERYGETFIEQSEKLFYHSSTAVMSFIAATVHNHDDLLRPVWCILSIDILLDDFALTLAEKLQIIRELSSGFKSEFKLTKQSQSQLNVKYRHVRREIESVLQGNQDSILSQVLAMRSTQIARIADEFFEKRNSGNSAANLSDLLKSYIHMEVNRGIPMSQRLHELVIYDFMDRYYISKMAKLQKDLMSKRH